MKFNPFQWHEVKHGQIAIPERRLRLRATQKITLYIQSEGYEALAGVSDYFDLEIQAEDAVAVFDIPDDARVFIFQYESVRHDNNTGEIYTNIDRKPMESGSVLAVKQAHLAFMRDIAMQRQIFANQMLYADRQARTRKSSAPAQPSAEPPAQSAAEPPAQTEQPKTQ